MTPKEEKAIRDNVVPGDPWTILLLDEIDSLREKYACLVDAAKHVTTVFHDERKGDLRLVIDSLSVALEGK